MSTDLTKFSGWRLGFLFIADITISLEVGGMCSRLEVEQKKSPVLVTVGGASTKN